MESFYNKISICSQDWDFIHKMEAVIYVEPALFFAGVVDSLNSNLRVDVIIYDRTSTDKRLEDLLTKKSEYTKVMVVSDDPDDFYAVVEHNIHGFSSSKDDITHILGQLQLIIEHEYPIDLKTRQLIFKRARKTYFYDLTNREHEILKLMEQHLTYKQMAGTLNITVNTIKSHIDNIYSKLNVTNKNEALDKVKALAS